MATTVRIELNNTQQILQSRHLEANGQAQRFFTSEVKRLSDPYTPFDNGVLKSNVTLEANSITYNVPYARYQYYGVSSGGRALNYQGAPTRGREWTTRMWADRGGEILQSISSFVGGRVEWQF